MRRWGALALVIAVALAGLLIPAAPARAQTWPPTLLSQFLIWQASLDSSGQVYTQPESGMYRVVCTGGGTATIDWPSGNDNLNMTIDCAAFPYDQQQRIVAGPFRVWYNHTMPGATIEIWEYLESSDCWITPHPRTQPLTLQMPQGYKWALSSVHGRLRWIAVGLPIYPDWYEVVNLGPGTVDVVVEHVDPFWSYREDVLLVCAQPASTPTPTSTLSPTPSPTGTLSPTPSPTPSPTGTLSPTPSPTPSPTGTLSPTPTPGGAGTPLPTPTPPHPQCDPRAIWPDHNNYWNGWSWTAIAYEENFQFPYTTSLPGTAYSAPSAGTVSADGLAYIVIAWNGNFSSAVAGMYTNGSLDNVSGASNPTFSQYVTGARGNRQFRAWRTNQSVTHNITFCVLALYAPASTPTATPSPTGTLSPTPSPTPSPTGTLSPTPTTLTPTWAPTQPAGLPLPPYVSPYPARPTAGGPTPDLGLTIPTLLPTWTPLPTPTGVTTATQVVGVIATLRAGMETPLAAVQTAGAGWDYERGREQGEDIAERIEPAAGWLAILNPQHPAWQAVCGPLYALRPALLPVLPILVAAIAVALARFVLWMLAWLIRLVDLIIQAIKAIAEIIPL